MGDIPATRYRERVVDESHEATERLANPKTLLFVSSGSLTTTDQVTGYQLGSILEASPRLRLSSRYEMSLTKAGSYSSSHVFLPFSYEKTAYELHSSNENCDTSASSAAFFEVRNVL